MFFRVSTAILAIVAGAFAVGDTMSASECDTSNLQCCSKLMSATNAASILGDIGDIGDLTGLVGLDCTPITAIGTGSGATCTQQPVCCNNVQQNGLVNVGCTPVNLGL